jgi:hypothetical protein
MRRALTLLILLTITTVIAAVYNTTMLVSLRAPFWIIWAVSFSAGVPLIGIFEAWKMWRSSSSEEAKRSAVILIVWVSTMQAAMLPLVERVQVCAAERAERAERALR